MKGSRSVSEVAALSTRRSRTGDWDATPWSAVMLTLHSEATSKHGNGCQWWNRIEEWDSEVDKPTQDMAQFQVYGLVRVLSFLDVCQLMGLIKGEDDMRSCLFSLVLRI